MSLLGHKTLKNNNDLTVNFELWFKQQAFYTNMVFKFGERLFFRDGDVYRALSVQMTYTAYCYGLNGEANELG